MQGLESGVPEVVCQGDQQGGITSGGGFSTYYPRLSFQTSSIAGYFAAAAIAGQTPIVGFGSGRGYPDVALLGHSYTVVIGGGSYFVSGTSASSPTMAGLFSNINAARLASGRGSIGWANPVLYQHSKLFVNDIVSGNNLCAADGTCCTQGFHAAPGWDPTTGLGSINFGKMVSFWGTLGNITGVPDPVSTSTPSTASTSSPVIAPAHPVNSSSAKTPTFTPTFSPTSDTNPLSVFYNMSGTILVN